MGFSCNFVEAKLKQNLMQIFCSLTSIISTFIEIRRNTKRTKENRRNSETLAFIKAQIAVGRLTIERNIQRHLVAQVRTGLLRIIKFSEIVVLWVAPYIY